MKKILEFRAQNEKLESQSVIASLNYLIEIHAMLFSLSNIYAFAQASVILTIEKLESTPFKKVIKSRVKYDQDRVNKTIDK